MTRELNPLNKGVWVVCLLILGLCFTMLLYKEDVRQNLTKMMSATDLTSYGLTIASSVNSARRGDLKNVTNMSCDLNNRMTQEERLRLISKTCSNLTRFRNSRNNAKVSSKRLYFSNKYNFSYCKVPKIGSTFWTQMFQVLQQGVNKSDLIFQTKRKEVHLKGYHNPKKCVAKLNRVVVVTRNPFSRLYSAFIDKSYLMLFPSLNDDVRRVLARPVNNETKQSFRCTKTISFSEFLEYIVKSIKKGRQLNEHWASVYSLCNPCNLNVSFVCKQESFATDVEQVLQTFGVHKNEFDVLMSALHDRRVEQSLPGIIETAYINTRNIRRCLDAKTLVHRLWESFQIQGFVSNQVRFPSQKFPSSQKFEDVKYVTQAIMDTIKEFPITSDESRSQRQSALAHAYEGVNQNIINDIQKIYELDFEMFGYSVQPPTSS